MEIWAKFAILVTAIPIITGLYFVLRSKNGGGVENVKTFIAAVYEHEPFDPLEECTKNVCEKEKALETIKLNMAVYKEQVLIAKSKGARIILFPENGLIGTGLYRQTHWPFGEYIPNVNDEAFDKPCEVFTDDDQDFFIQHHLSCLARDHEIYIAAGVIDVQHCQECGEDKCLYNSAIVYDNNGKLVAKYHKWNLWPTELFFNIDPEPGSVYFDTDFGRFGLIICEDILFSPPTKTLADELKIDTMLFPTEWWDLLPHQMPHSLMQAFSMGYQINWLGANYHHGFPTNGTGSGIYTTDGVLDWYHNSTGSGKLLTAELPVSPRKYHVDWSQFAREHKDSFPVEGRRFKAEIYDDQYEMIEMDPTKNQIKVCNNDNGRHQLCCLVNYEYKANQIDGLFSLGVFEGNHTKDASIKGSMGFAVCTVLKCNFDDPSRCDTKDLKSSTYFTKLELSGTFGAKTKVLPEAWFDGGVLSKDLPKVLPDGRFVLSANDNPGRNLPLGAMTLYGRNYFLDGPIPDKFCPQ